MKVVVLESFDDKYTKDFHKKGEVIEVSRERFIEINESGTSPFVKEVKKSKEAGE